MKRLLFAIGCAAVASVVVACGGKQGGEAGAPTTTSADSRDGVRDLNSIDGFRAAFNAHRGEPRLILIISPT